MATLVPGGTPNPDGDRRFAERAFPLLEPVSWPGERHRGGYGVQDPGNITISLELIFGPWDPFVSEPRLAITVGSFPIDITSDHAPWLVWSRLVASRDELQCPPSADRLPARGRVRSEIEGRMVDFDSLHCDRRWVAQGRWQEHAVEIHAVRIQPASVHQQLAQDVPER